MKAGGRFGVFSCRRSRCLITLGLRVLPVWCDCLPLGLCLLQYPPPLHHTVLIPHWEQNPLKVVFSCVEELRQRWAEDGDVLVIDQLL